MENREVIKRVFPEMFEHYSIHPVDDYPSQLYEMLASLTPRGKSKPVIVVLTPGVFNSAYFEHSFLAQEMGTELVEGCDLFVDHDDCVYVKTIDGPVRVDVIYRRIDDIFLDPEVFRKDSVLGISGIMRSWQKGKVAIANAPGSGVADDKVIYAFVPEMIRYYLNEDAILPNVQTYLCMNREQRSFVLDHIDELVVKPANESGGYGIVIGPHASEAERRKTVRDIKKTPRNFIAQPMLALSTAPTLCERNAEPRHLDLRPFILQGDSVYVTMGGLTRVALKKGSLVVNSSQGGGSKDTWIVERNI
ncbi:MAG: circularly permuted type 2 ATP-grasp protein, partial [Methylococcales bacterium]